MKYQYSLVAALLLPVALLVSPASRAETVNQGNITSFDDGQPALADEVNGNFNELITQINDHASRLTGIEGDAVLLGDNAVTVNCDTDGASALQDAIDANQHAADELTINAAGACGGVNVQDRRVTITATANVTITGNGTDPAVQVNEGVLSLFAFGGPSITVNANGANRAAQVTGHGVLWMGSTVGQITVAGGTELQVGLFRGSHLLCFNVCNIGAANDNASGLVMDSSLTYFFDLSFVGTTTLNILSSGSAVSSSNSHMYVFRENGGTVRLNVPNAFEIDFHNGSTGELGLVDFAATDRIRISDNSQLNFESNLIPGSTTSTWSGKIVVDRNSVLRLNFEDSPNDITVTHTGDLEVGVNSSLEVFGVNGVPGTLSVASGSGKLSAVVGSNAIFNSATFAGSEIELLANSSVIFSDNSSYSAVSQPTINVSFDSQLIDFDSVDGFLTGDVTSCSTGGTAYDSSGDDACPVPP